MDECYRGRSVRVFRFDQARAIGALRARAARLLGERPEIVEIRLFGSLAARRAMPGSDADIWILLAEDSRPFLQRGAELAVHFRGIGVGCDVLAYTEAEWRLLKAEGRRIVHAVESDGVLLASREAKGLSRGSQAGTSSSQ